MIRMNIQAVSDDLSPQDVERYAEICGWTTAPEPIRVALTRCFGVESITACLSSPFVGGCEVDEAGGSLPGQRFLAHLQVGGIGLSVSTGSAYQYDLALTFTAALARRYPELAPLAEDIERSVHELVANAVVHGNLNVASPKPGLEGFDLYCKSLDAALADPARVARRVDISAFCAHGAMEIAVLDHGAGYDVHDVTRIDVDYTPRQHGLAIIAAAAQLRVEDEGRCSILRFCLGAP